ncbi:hypothetical protein ACVBEQ_23340 [Nakamurella sp. GG22]
MGITSVIEPVTLTVDAPRAARPGDSFEAVIKASALGNPVVEGEVTLINRVTYRYRQFGAFGGATTAHADRTEVVDRQVLHPYSLRRTESVIGVVTLRVPVDALPSVTGELVQIAWGVRVRLHVPGVPDAEESRPVRLLLAPDDRPFVVSRPPRVVDHRAAVLSFDALAGGRVTPGSILTGTLTVAAIKPLTARALRVELVLLEQVHHGPWVGNDDATVIPEGQQKETQTPIATATLATGLRMGAQRQDFPFSLAIPQVLPGPSLDTREFTVSWLLRGVLDRVHRPDPLVEVELQGITAPERTP